MHWYVWVDDYEFLLPFLCHQCGVCCEAPPPECVLSGLGAIAEHFDTSVEDLLRSKFEGMVRTAEEGGRRFLEKLPGWEVRPCPFLSKDRSCEVYAARPRGCRLFPLSTTGGPCGIPCPGHREFHRALDRFFKPGAAAAAGPQRGSGFEGRCPTREEWQGILREIEQANVSPAFLKRFLRLNGLPLNATH